MASPMPEVMDRASPPSTSKGLLHGCVAHSRPGGHHSWHPPQEAEQVFTTAQRHSFTECGKLHYCLACPGWSKVTTARVVYPLGPHPHQQGPWPVLPCCNFGAPTLTGSRRTLRSRTPSGDGECSVLAGGRWTRSTRISSSMPGHQTPCQVEIASILIIDRSSPPYPRPHQVCRGEGDLVLYRKAGADLSDSSEVYVLPDVVRPLDVFNDITFELSKTICIAAGAPEPGWAPTYGTSMPARCRRPASKPWRACLLRLADRKKDLHWLRAAMRCCCPPIYKVTSSASSTRNGTCGTLARTRCPRHAVLLLCTVLARECCALGASAAGRAAQGATSKQGQAAQAEESMGCRFCASP